MLVDGALYGREREQSLLRAALAAAADGRGSCWRVEGDPGIGKTALCEAIEADARGRGLRVAWGVCSPATSGTAHWPWRQCFAHLGLDVELAPEGRGAARTSAQLHHEVFDALARGLRVPTLLLIEDLHWADDGSIRLLEFLAPNTRPLPLVVVVTARQSARLAFPAHVLTLDGLDADDSERLGLAIASGARVAAAELHRRTGGNPLFISELIRYAADRPGAELPVTVRGAIAAKLADCSPRERLLLSAAAVLGRDFSVDDLSELTAESRDDTLLGVSALAGRRVLSPRPLGRFDFVHDLVSTAVLEEMGVARRVRLHQRAADMLAGRSREGTAVDAARVAHHYVEALAAGTAGDAYCWARAAAEASRRSTAYDDEARWLQAACRAVDLDRTAGLRLETLLALARAESACGDLGRARATYLRVAAEARASGDHQALGRAALGVGSGEGFEVSMWDTEQVALLEEASAALGDEPGALLAHLLGRLSVALSLTGVDDRRASLADRAVAMAESVGDDAALAAALAARCDVVSSLEHSEERAGMAGRIVAIALGAKDRPLELLGRRLRIVALAEQGRFTELDAEVDAYARAADALRQPLYSWYVPLWRAMRASMRGRAGEARRLIDEAAALGEQAQSQNARVLTVGARFFLLIANRGGDPGAVADAREAVVAHLDELPALEAWAQVTGAYGLAHAGRHEEARRELDAALPSIDRFPVDSEWVDTMVQYTEAIAILGGYQDACEHLYELLLPNRDRFAIEGIGMHCHGVLERHLGMLAARLGRPDVARTHFDAALRRHAAIGATGLVLRTIEDAAAHLGEPAPLAVVPAPSGSSAGNRFRLVEGRWLLEFQGQRAEIKDSKGMRDLAALLASPGREHAALDLVAAALDPGAAAEGGPATVIQHGLGPTLDDRARSAYRRRLEELERELDDADARGDAARSAAAKREWDFLVAELGAAYGLGGRPRPVGESAERARSTVAWRIRDAIGRIERSLPGLGAHLRNSVKTGRYCVYQPETPQPWDTGAAASASPLTM